MTQPASKKIFLNAASAVLQVVTVGLMYFFLYKYLIKQIGVKQLGVWSLVVSSTSIANMANFGITSGLVKFVAEFVAKEKVDELKKLIFTALISILMFFSIFVSIAYLLLHFFIDKIIDKQYINLAIAMLPYALFCLVINEVSGVFTSVLEGIQKNYIKNFIYINTSIIFLISTFFFVPIYGLMGVVYAQLIQSLIILLASFFISKKYIDGFSLFIWHWDKTIFKSLISYGSKFQLVSLLQILYEPTTKVLLSKFGGLQVVGFYEMASRFISQIRAVINSANQVMIPVVAQAAQKSINDVMALYKLAMSLTLLVAVPIISAVVVFSIYVCNFWIGHYEPNFILPLTLLSISTFFNVMCGPAYYSSLGEGKLSLLVFVHILMAVTNVLLGLILGKLFGGTGVVWAWMLTLLFGSLILTIKYQQKIKFRIKNVFLQNDYLLMSVGLFISVSLAIINNKLFNINCTLNIYIVFLFFIVCFVPVLLMNNNVKTIFKRFK